MIRGVDLTPEIGEKDNPGNFSTLVGYEYLG
jgi:hypothetical protein